MGCAADFCGKTVTPYAKDVVKGLVNHLEQRYNSEQLDEAGFRIHTSSCINNCCANLIAEIGLAGRLTKENDSMKQNYDILLGGSFGIKPILGRRVEENVSVDELKDRIDFLLANYFKKRMTSERLRAFCNRCTVEELKSYMNSIEG